VEEIAQGRTWSGKTARELGLVDALGGLQEAVAAAAGLAGLEEYELTYVEQKSGPGEKLLRMLGDQLGGRLGREDDLALRLFESVRREIGFTAQMNDPQGAYAWCTTCEVK
jgi:protease-4